MKMFQGREQNFSLLSLDAVLKIQGARLNECGGHKNRVGEFCFTSVCIDSRDAAEKSLFAALAGTQRNGHDFIPQALEKGASVILALQSDYDARQSWYKNFFEQYPRVYFIFVPDTLYALQNIAEFYVEKFPSLIKIGITGSSGKTTTKEIAFSILSQKFNTVRNEGNLNTETGLPLSVFKIRAEHEAGIFELGMNRKNEIAEIARVLKPKYALITNIGNAHVGLLGSVDAIAQEKKQIFKFFTDDCTAVIPRDDSYADFLRKDTPGNILYYSGAEQDLHNLGIGNIIDNGINGTSFMYEGEPVSFGLAGRYNFKNLLAVLTLARALGLSHNEIIRGISDAKPYSGRSEIIRGERIIIQDCYNANPSSMAASLDFFKNLSVNGKKTAVLADMFELGDTSPAMHEKIVSLALDSRVDHLVLIGNEMTAAYSRVKKTRAKTSGAVYTFDSWDDDHIARAAELLSGIAKKGDAILIKGSRSTGLERLAQKLCEKKGAA